MWQIFLPPVRVAKKEAKIRARIQHKKEGKEGGRRKPHVSRIWEIRHSDLTMHRFCTVEFGKEQEARLMWSLIKRQEPTVLLFQSVKLLWKLPGVIHQGPYSAPVLYICSGGYAHWVFRYVKYGVVLVSTEVTWIWLFGRQSTTRRLRHWFVALLRPLLSGGLCGSV